MTFVSHAMKVEPTLTPAVDLPVQQLNLMRAAASHRATMS